ncbi:MAG TPA: hypothetical protein VN259_04390 [Xanthomonadales bacterium]|nr:hypothetical protein [Xanthomonadales bacterium]
MTNAQRKDRNCHGLLLALLLPMAPALAAGAVCAPPYAVGTTQPTLVDPARDNRSIPVRLHYPASAAGAGTPALTGCGFPIIAFGHGFTIGAGAYAWLADALAAAGFIVVMPATEGGLSPDHGEFGRDLGYLSEALSATSPWNQAAGNGRAIGGHSMGGGAAVLGVAGTSGIAALFALAPAQTNPSAITAASGVVAATLFITGSRDCVTPSTEHAGPILAALATPASLKQQSDIDGASHCQFSGGSLSCSIGESSCGGGATISASSQQAQTLALLIPWLQQQFTPQQALLADGFE